MDNNGSFQVWKDRMFAWGTTFGIASLCAFGGWVVTELRNQPTREERIQLINEVSPYNEDRKLIFDRLERCERNIREIRERPK